MGLCRKSQRLSFWSHYGQLKHHMQACDQLLDRINACAGLPGRPNINVPASISRKVPIKCMPRLHCKTPHINPSTPFEACLNLSFTSDCLAQPDKLPSEDLEPCHPLTPEIESQYTSSKCPEILSDTEGDPTVSSDTTESHDLHDQRIDISLPVSPSLELWPVKSTSSEITELLSPQESSHIISNSNLKNQSGHIPCNSRKVHNSCVPSPIGPPVECSYYLKSVLSSNQKIYITSSAVKHTAYSRLETFVIRSRSIRTPVLQQRK